MHSQSETSLRKLASQCLNKHGPDAWEIYRDEARARYAREDDGPRAKYDHDSTALFLKVAHGTKGAVRRMVKSGRIQLPTLHPYDEAEGCALDKAIAFTKAVGALDYEGVDPVIVAQRLVEELYSFHHSLDDGEDAPEKFADFLDPDELESVIDWLSEIAALQRQAAAA